MKKIIISILLVLGAAALPIIGQKITQAELDSKIDELKTYGLEVKNPSIDSSYLNTSNHYEFALKDSEKFLNYLSQMSGDKLPSYTKSLLDGTVVGADIKYSNIAFASDMEIEIYPLALPKQTAADLKKNDANLFKFIDGLLDDKALLYHINYNLGSKDFDGYVKDIDKSYTDASAKSVNFKISGLTYIGNGSLFKPQMLKSNLDEITISVTDKDEKVSFILKKLKVNTDFKTLTTYSSQVNLKSMKVDVEGISQFHTSLDNLNFNLAADTQGNKAFFDTKTSVKEFTMSSKDGDIVLKKFNYEVNLKDIDKDSFEELRVLVSKIDTMNEIKLQKEIQTTLAKLFSKGLVLDLKDLSIDEIEIYNNKKSKGFSLKSNIVLKADKDFEKKLKTFPAKLANNLSIDTVFKISKSMFELVNKEAPISEMASKFAKEEGDKLVFEIKFIDSKLTVNGKKI